VRLAQELFFQKLQNRKNSYMIVQVFELIEKLLK
jgi:hypothetical protein